MAAFPHSLLLLGAMMALLACAPGVTPEPEANPQDPKTRTAAAPMIGATDSQDRADRSCQVLLRRVYRNWDEQRGDYETWCGEQGCTYVWRGEVDVDSQASLGAVSVMYRLSTSSTWYDASTLEVPSDRPGYRTYAFVLSEHLFGPGDPETPVPSVEMVAYAQTPEGGRLFDHNVHRGDLENTVLDARNDFREDAFLVCVPVVGFIAFDPAWNTYTSGPRRQGGWLQVEYALDRLPECRATHNGHPFWNIDLHARFLPGEQHLELPLRSNPRQVFPIPEDAQEVEIWFVNYNGGGDSFVQYDSAYGQNYRFDIWPAADHPRCRGVEKDNAQIVNGDMRFVHNEAWCTPYDISANYDATFCEFFPDTFGIGYEGHYGIPYRWIFAWVQVRPMEGDVLGVGMMTRYRDAVSGEEGLRFSFGTPMAPDRWRVGFVYEQQVYAGTMKPLIQATVEEFAFFLDVRRPNGEVVRLWQSRQGQNYSLAEVESQVGWTESIPYGQIRMAGEEATVFDPKRACGN